MTDQKKTYPLPGHKTISPWRVLKREQVFTAPPWIHVERQAVSLPDGRVVDDYYRISLADCVIVFAKTPDNMVIVERQYRHGSGVIGLSLPAGTLENDEDPLAAGKRELLEETGHDAENWCSLGCFVFNGNYGCGKAHVFFANNACKVAEPNSDDLEDTEILYMSLQELLDALRDGRVPLLGTAAAIMLVAQFLDKPPLRATESEAVARSVE